MDKIKSQSLIIYQDTIVKDSSHFEGVFPIIRHEENPNLLITLYIYFFHHEISCSQSVNGWKITVQVTFGHLRL